MDFIDRLVHESYAAHHIIMNMGFEPEAVQACLRNIINGDPPGLHACVIVERDGREFVIHLQPVSEPQGADFQQRWLAFAAMMPTLERAVLDEIVESTAMWQMRAQLLCALEAKGFTLAPGRMVH